MATPCLPINLTTGPKHLKRKKPLHNNTRLQREGPPIPPPQEKEKEKDHWSISKLFFPSCLFAL